MSEYRRMVAPGGLFFLTLVTERRLPIFEQPKNVAKLRSAVAAAKAARPFEMLGAVILPDHMHWLIELPPDDSDFSTRVGMVKASFTKSLTVAERPQTPIGASRQRQREQTVWQRRFWEHTIRDERDLDAHMDYIHFNPVKHGLATCPHTWEYSSFARWVKQGRYPADWACTCGGRIAKPPNFEAISASVGE